jgi:hypothetical protein
VAILSWSVSFAASSWNVAYSSIFHHRNYSTNTGSGQLTSDRLWCAWTALLVSWPSKLVLN